VYEAALEGNVADKMGFLNFLQQLSFSMLKGSRQSGTLKS